MFEVSSIGIKCRFPVAEVDGITIVVLLCETNNQHLGLLLHPAGDNDLYDPTRKLYYVSRAFLCEETQSFHLFRFAYLGGDLYNLRYRGKTLKPSWRDIYISPAPRSQDSPDPTHLILQFWPDRAWPTPFRIPRRILRTLIDVGLTPTSGLVVEGTKDSPWHVWAYFYNPVSSEAVRVVFGLCSKSLLDGRRPHWAWAEPATRTNWTAQEWRCRSHECALDHVDTWPGAEKAFGDAERTIWLSFGLCPYSPSTTLQVHIELAGTFYTAIARGTDVVRPATVPPPTLPEAPESLPAPVHSPAPEPVLDHSDGLEDSLLSLNLGS